jgi:HEPN domain-containing protein
LSRSTKKSEANYHQVLWVTAIYDFRAASRLSGDQTISPNTIGMHLQQTVEKAAKAYLAKVRVSYKFTHHIDKLFEYMERKVEVPEQFGELGVLTPFGEGLRYEMPVAPDEFQVERFMELTEEFLQWIADIGEFEI